MALTDNLSAYWKLDESSGNAADSSGAGITLTNNGTTAFAAALINNGADFGSSNSTKYFSTTNTVGVDGGNITMAGWIKPIAISSGRYDIFTQYNNTSKVTYRLSYEYNSGTPRLVFVRTRDGIIDNQFFYTITLSTSSYTYLALTYNGTIVTGYVNGTSVGTVSASGTGSGSSTSGFALGGSIGGGNNVSGLCDEVGVWSRALDGSELTTLYNGGSGLSYPFIPTSSNAFFMLFN